MNSTETTTAGGSDPEQMEHHASVLRAMLASSLQQLETRWKNMFNLQSQAQNHPLAFILAGTGALLAIAGSIALAENHRRHSFSYKFKKGVCNLQKGLHQFERSLNQLYN